MLMPKSVAAMLVAGMAVTILSSCATYSDRLSVVRGAAENGDFAAGVERLDKLLDVAEPGTLPDAWKSDSALLVLERATLQQAVGNYSLSAQDFQAADKELDLLDISGDVGGKIGKYFFSDSSTKYKSSPTEKLSLNAFNMLNYLTEHDLAGARVEAKRFTVMQNYLKDFKPEHAHGVFGSYLAGFVFEQLGDWSTAMRYYDEALGTKSFATLATTVKRLSAVTSYRGRNIQAFLDREGAGARSAAKSGSKPSELLVVVSVGRVPRKEPKRMPVGLAVGYVGTAVTEDFGVLERSAMKVLVYPELVDATPLYRDASLRLDGESVPIELASDLGSEIAREYEDLKPKIITAALVRMAARAAVAEGARAAGKEIGGGEGLGILAALVTEGLMVAADRPDTRSWESMPHWVYLYRSEISPGHHTVEVSLRGSGAENRNFEVDVPRGGYTALIVTAPR